jgi:hypothetical protein
MIAIAVSLEIKITSKCHFIKQFFIHIIKSVIALFVFQASNRVDPLGMGTNVGVQTVQSGRAHGLDGRRGNGEKNRHLRLGVQVPQRASFVSL